VQRRQISYQDAVFGVRRTTRANHEHEAGIEAYIGGVQMASQRWQCAEEGALTTGLAAVSLDQPAVFPDLLRRFAAALHRQLHPGAEVHQRPAKLGTLFTVTGLSLVGLIAQMVSLWKQKVTADVLALLARNLLAWRRSSSRRGPVRKALGEAAHSRVGVRRTGEAVVVSIGLVF
jgi:hypothetical protein